MFIFFFFRNTWKWPLFFQNKRFDQPSFGDSKLCHVLAILKPKCGTSDENIASVMVVSQRLPLAALTGALICEASKHASEIIDLSTLPCTQCTEGLNAQQWIETWGRYSNCVVCTSGFCTNLELNWVNFKFQFTSWIWIQVGIKIWNCSGKKTEGGLKWIKWNCMTNF